jgi:hypothetical protein
LPKIGYSGYGTPGKEELARFFRFMPGFMPGFAQFSGKVAPGAVKRKQP